MRILHVVAGLPRAGGGLSELVPRFALESASLGHDVIIATVAGSDEPLSEAATEAEDGGVRIVRYSPSTPRTIFFSRAMLQGLGSLVASADVVHVHSCWTFPVWWACECAIRVGKPFVMSPQGCLDPVRLHHSAWKKRVAGFFDRRFLRQATAIHATSDAESGWIARYVGGRPAIAVIPNGVELPQRKPASQSTDRRRQVLFLGRLHPLKGLDLLLEAWQHAVRGLSHNSKWQLVIAGPDEQGTRSSLEKQVAELGLSNVSFVGPLYGGDKRKALSDCDLFVLPSRSENFGIAVAEALAAGVPVIATKGSPWGEIEGVCGWWVDTTVEGLSTALDAAMRTSDEDRRVMGNRGRELVAARYQWNTVARAMIQLYTDCGRICCR